MLNEISDLDGLIFNKFHSNIDGMRVSVNNEFVAQVPMAAFFERFDAAIRNSRWQIIQRTNLDERQKSYTKSYCYNGYELNVEYVNDKYFGDLVTFTVSWGAWSDCDNPELFYFRIWEWALVIVHVFCIVSALILNYKVWKDR